MHDIHVSAWANKSMKISSVQTFHIFPVWQRIISCPFVIIFLESVKQQTFPGILCMSALNMLFWSALVLVLFQGGHDIIIMIEAGVTITNSRAQNDFVIRLINEREGRCYYSQWLTNGRVETINLTWKCIDSVGASRSRTQLHTFYNPHSKWIGYSHIFPPLEQWFTDEMSVMCAIAHWKGGLKTLLAETFYFQWWRKPESRACNTRVLSS